MKADHVNAFLVPSVEVVQKMARTAVEVGKISRFHRTLTGDAFSIVIGLNGGISGSVILTSARDVAWALAGRIMREDLSTDAETDVMAVMSELANTIVGNATGYLCELGMTEEITPPTVVMGPVVSFELSEGAETILVPLETEVGVMEMIVSLKKRKPS